MLYLSEPAFLLLEPDEGWRTVLSMKVATRIFTGRSPVQDPRHRLPDLRNGPAIGRRWLHFPDKKMKAQIPEIRLKTGASKPKRPLPSFPSVVCVI